MSAITLNNDSTPQSYVPPALQKSPASPPTGKPPEGSTTTSAEDSLHLSPAALREIALTGRVALNAQAGNITSDQAQQLYSQISSIHSEIVADKEADGGTLSPTDAEAIQQQMNQLSQTVYGDAHNGATPPADPTINRAGLREVLQAGRIALNEKAGKLSSDQAGQLYSQFGTIHQQISVDEAAAGGKLSGDDVRAINHLQNKLSLQIYDAVHDVSSPDSSAA